jgi:hypothetical protein
MEALRLVSEKCEHQVEGSRMKSWMAREGTPLKHKWLYGASLPSKEILLALLWTLRMEERKMRRSKSEGFTSVSKLGSSTKISNKTYILKVISPIKRQFGGSIGYSDKRCRLG